MNGVVEFHPIASLFPMMDPDAFAELVADVREYGLREPIWLYQGKIVDGRNRYLACLAAGVEPEFRTFQGDDVVSFIVSLNLKRRHLNESQRGMVHARLATLPKGANQHTAIAAPSQGQAAELLNVSVDTGQRARKVLDSGNPELIAAVDQGLIPVSRAVVVAELPESLQDGVLARINAGMKPTEALRQARREALPETVAQLPAGKYRVLYADPPWDYGDTRQTLDRFASTGAAHHYATMTVDELAALDVASLAADNAVMLMWATFPFFPDAVTLLKAWGFTYKTAFVWDKGHGAFGSYHDADAELLLIGTVGSCVPEAEKKEKQIQRFPRGRHSAKPEEWRALIDRLWPSGPRVELFRRGDVPDHWTVWGAEVEDGTVVA